jgi:hypothetical protein
MEAHLDVENFEGLREALLAGDVKPVQYAAPIWRTQLLACAADDRRLVALADELVRHLYADRLEGIRDLLDRISAALAEHDAACGGTTHCDLSRRAA